MFVLIALTLLGQDRVAAPSLAIPEKSIFVDLKTQTLTAKEADKRVYVFPCSTGRNNKTPSGEWPIRAKARWNKSLAEYGSVEIPYSLKLDIVQGGRRHLISIHAYRSVPRYPASHGCIRLRAGDAKKLFEWAKVGTVVRVK